VPDFVAPQPGYGLVLNYRLSASLGNDIFGEGPKFASSFADLEARAYTPFGVLVTTGSVSGSDLAFSNPQVRRHDTYFTYSNPNRMLTLTAGDFVSSTLPWGRPIRLGGVQIRRDFNLRSDVVTTPRLSYTGTAAVPSSIDVYVDNVRAWSGTTSEGPFKVSDLPFVTSSGEAVVVIRDEGGNEQVVRLPFFAGRDVLKAGTFDFSVDAGRPRSGFGGGSGPEYDDETVATASLRYGVTDRLTMLGHLEYGYGLTAGSLGATAILFNRAEATLAYGQSSYLGETGWMAYGKLRTRIGRVDLQFSSRRSSEGYADLAYVTGAERLAEDAPPEDFARLRPAKATDALTLSFNDLFEKGSLGLSLIHSERLDQKNLILSASYSQRLWDKGPSVRVSGFKDFEEGGFGMSLGLSMTLGDRTFAGVGLSRTRSGDISNYASLSRPVGREVGSYGYRISASDLHNGGRAEISGAYRTPAGLGQLRLWTNDGGAVAGSASFEGSVVVAGGAILPGNYIRDGFAVVKVGVPGVPVSLHGREVARTGLFGAALVPDLQAYRSNRVSINPESLPLDASVNATAMTVVPARKSGVTVNFGAGRTAAALLTVRGPDGAFLPAGTPVRLTGQDETFIVGYDGELWLEGLKASNTLTATLDRGTCTARFTYAASPDEIVTIDGVECR
jgi:outer membrane usher protein